MFVKVQLFASNSFAKNYKNCVRFLNEEFLRLRCYEITDICYLNIYHMK